MSPNLSFLRFPLIGLALIGIASTGFFLGKGLTNSSSSGTVFAGSTPFDTAARGNSLSMATGVIELGTDAMYTLDHLTGDLTCWILNPRNGAVSVQFRVSAATAMGITGEADYVMTTGYMDFSGANEGNAKPAHSVVYVGDGNSGKAVGFVLMYNKQAIARGDATGGELRLISQMETRGINSIRPTGK